MNIYIFFNVVSIYLYFSFCGFLSINTTHRHFFLFYRSKKQNSTKKNFLVFLSRVRAYDQKKQNISTPLCFNLSKCLFIIFHLLLYSFVLSFQFPPSYFFASLISKEQKKRKSSQSIYLLFM